MSNLNDYSKPLLNSHVKFSSRRTSKQILGLTVVISFATFIVISECFSSWSWMYHSLRVQKDDADWTSLPPGTVKWWPCNLPGDIKGSECGFIITPLDYFNSSAGVAKVGLGRYKAKKHPRKGSILINPGGPGASGKAWVTQQGTSFQAFMGENYDIVGFDPRGTELTEPGVKCFNRQDALLFGTNSVLQTGFDISPNVSDPRTRDHLLVQQRQAIAYYKTAMKVCESTMGETLRYMGSSTIARDVDFIITILEGRDALINFWGISYGSILGSYIVNMFPNRVGRVVIDGIAHPGDWASTPSYKSYRQWLVDTDAVYDMFFSECSKWRCALARHVGEEPALIKSRVDKFLEKLYYEPMPVPGAVLPGLLTQGIVQKSFFIILQNPLVWPDFANYLHEAMNGNATILLNQNRFGNFGLGLNSNAVFCNDNAASKPPTAEELIDEGLSVLKEVSRFAFVLPFAEAETAGCQYWPVTPSERFEGPWNQTLRNPILVISNELDPVTPLDSGRWIRGQLGQSARIVIREGIGHTTITLPSICSGKIIRNYFLDGTLPPDEQSCTVDPFKKSPIPLPKDDEYLLAKLHELSEFYNRWFRWPTDPSWRL